MNKAENFLKSLFNWLLLAEKESEEKFEEKYKRGLNLARLTVISALILISPILHILIELLGSYLKASPEIIRLLVQGLLYIFSFILIYILVILYKAWIQKIWDFLKKDAIVHYISMAIIPALLIFLGYQYIHKGKTEFPPNIFKSNEVKEVEQQYDEIIDRLNGFYSSLFTGVAVIAALVGVSAWRGFKEMKDKLERFKDFEGKIKFIYEKKELSDLVQKKYDKEYPDKTLSSIYFDLTEEESAKIDKIEKQILDETTDDSWLKLVYANLLLNGKKGRGEDEHYIKIEFILNYIENRDLLKEDSLIKKRLLHLKGLLYWFWYEAKKAEFRKKKAENNKNLWMEWWKGNDRVEDYDTWKYKNTELLGKSIEYYEKTLILCETTFVKDKNINETLGNLPVVLLELSHFKGSIKEIKDMPKFRWGRFKNEKVAKESCWDYAEECSTKDDEQDFNTKWDDARVKFYSNREKYKVKRNYNKDIKGMLDDVVSEISTLKDKKFFIESITNEQKEFIGAKSGFPGFDDEVKRLKNELSKKNLS